MKDLGESIILLLYTSVLFSKVNPFVSCKLRRVDHTEKWHEIIDATSTRDNGLGSKKKSGQANSSLEAVSAQAKFMRQDRFLQYVRHTSFTGSIW
jgi:hypothetical protein